MHIFSWNIMIIFIWKLISLMKLQMCYFQMQIYTKKSEHSSKSFIEKFVFGVSQKIVVYCDWDLVTSCRHMTFSQKQLSDIWFWPSGLRKCCHVLKKFWTFPTKALVLQLLRLVQREAVAPWGSPHLKFHPLIYLLVPSLPLSALPWALSPCINSLMAPQSKVPGHCW